MVKTIKAKTDVRQDPLSQIEGKFVADFLAQKGTRVHWTTLWRMTPHEIAEKYGTTSKDVITACKRKVST